MTTSIVEKRPIFDFVYGMAVNDALNQTYDNTNGDKDALLENTVIKDIVWEYYEEIISGNKPCIYRYGQKIQEVEGNKPKSFTFGKIQKLINMTMKYLYIRHFNTEASEGFIDCDAPMDRIMMDLIYYYKKQTKDVCHFRNTQSWSSIDWSDISDYKGFQDDVRSIIGSNVSKIEFDYDVWDAAKKLRNMPLKDRGQEAEQIINKFLSLKNKSFT